MSDEVTTDEPVRLLSLAQRLNLPARWLKSEAVAGRLPCLRIGRHFLFNPQAIQAALAQRAATSKIESKTPADESLQNLPADVRGSAMGMRLSINTLTDEQRTSLLDFLFGDYCLECGSRKPCYCMADE